VPSAVAVTLAVPSSPEADREAVTVFPPLSVYTVYSKLPLSANVPRFVEKVTRTAADRGLPSLSKSAAVTVEVLKPLAGMLAGLALSDMEPTDDGTVSSPVPPHETTNMRAQTINAIAKPFWRYLIFISQLLMSLIVKLLKKCSKKIFR
jgi:hypothetical protein